MCKQIYVRTVVKESYFRALFSTLHDASGLELESIWVRLSWFVGVVFHIDSSANT